MEIYLTTIINILKTIALAWVITKFDPIQWILQDFKPKKYLPLILLFEILITITTCLMCCSMWLGFIIGGFWNGIMCYIIAFVYNKYLSEWEYKIKFKPDGNAE